MPRKMSVQTSCSPLLVAFLTRTDGGIVSDSVSLHTLAQQSFKELQGLLPLLAFHSRNDGRIVSGSGNGIDNGSGAGNCSGSGSSSGKGQNGAGGGNGGRSMSGSGHGNGNGNGGGSGSGSRSSGKIWRCQITKSQLAHRCPSGGGGSAQLPADRRR